MPEPPKAHRRLVPRVPKEPAKKSDSDTVKHAKVEIEIEPDDSMEMTAVRESPLAPKRPSRPSRPLGPVDRPSDPIVEIEEGHDDDDDDLSLDITAQRRSAPPSALDNLDLDDDEVATEDPDADADANETMAIPARVDTEPPEPLPEFPDPPPRRDFPIPTYAMTAAKEAVPRFGPNWATLAGDGPPSARQPSAQQPVAKPLATGSSMPSLNAVEQIDSFSDAIEPNAFSDLEPTALKTPISPSHQDGAEDRPTTHISPAERGLLAAMSEGHEASRKIYMQWLERRGEKTRAEYLRIEMQLAAMNPLDIRYQETQDQLRDVAQKISVDWRSRVSRSLIENCRNPAVRCPAYWRALPADTDDVRTCGMCKEQVFYCVTIELARGRVAAGERVALDVTVERAPDDLEPRCAGCHFQLPRDTRFCPQCGRSTMY